MENEDKTRHTNFTLEYAVLLFIKSWVLYQLLIVTQEQSFGPDSTDGCPSFLGEASTEIRYIDPVKKRNLCEYPLATIY
jgi:hypothetical protein